MADEHTIHLCDMTTTLDAHANVDAGEPILAHDQHRLLYTLNYYTTHECTPAT